MSNPKTYFFCGLGGSGMSALAQIMHGRGYRIIGSDRDYDRGLFPDKFQNFKDLGFELYPQDGSGIQHADILVVSAAVEDHIPDVKAALEQGKPIQKRPELLAEIFNDSRGIAIGGTSGKSTVTGMLSHILHETGHQPTVMNGAKMLNSGSNACIGNDDLFMIEACESDGSIDLYRPEIAVLNNITLDHKPLPELREIFTKYLTHAKLGAVINHDDPEAGQLTQVHPNTLSFSRINEHADLYIPQIDLQVLGRHNQENALAAIGAAKLLGIEVEQSLEALTSFKGIQSRLEVVGQANDITVIDDFGHNPDKIKASLETLKETNKRLLVMYQSHGFGPTRMMWGGLVDVFSTYLSKDDILWMPDIYYAGGTAQKDISSKDLISEIKAKGIDARHLPHKDEIAVEMRTEAKSGDILVIMGARDDTLRQMAHKLGDDIAQKTENSQCA